MKNDAPVLLVSFRGSRRAVIHSLGNVDAVALLQHVFAVTFRAAIVVTNHLVHMSMPWIQSLRSVGRDARSDGDTVLRIVKTKKFALPAAAAMRSAACRALILSDNDWTFDGIPEGINFGHRCSFDCFNAVLCSYPMCGKLVKSA